MIDQTLFLNGEDISKRPTHISAVATVLLMTKTFTERERERERERENSSNSSTRNKPKLTLDIKYAIWTSFHSVC